MDIGDKSTNSEILNTPVGVSNQTFVEGFSDGIGSMWYDVNSLGAVLVLSTLLGCFLIHHVDLRQRLMGARMRIACCSLIYRKVSGR